MEAEVSGRRYPTDSVYASGFLEKCGQVDLAKAAGARWHPRRKVWYVVDPDDLTPFAKWLPPPPRINHRADSYSLLESSRDCWKCRRDTRVFGFAIPRGHDAKLGDFETIEEYDAPLRPISTESASRLLRYPVNERVEADASSALPTDDELECR